MTDQELLKMQMHEEVRIKSICEGRETIVRRVFNGWEYVTCQYFSSDTDACAMTSTFVPEGLDVAAEVTNHY